MKIIHRISINGDERQMREFHSAGVDLRVGSSTFVIAEHDPRWPDIAELVQKHGALDFVSTNFSAAERSRSEYLSMDPTWHHGYPQPSDDRSYLQETYDLSHYCASCGIGKRQVKPFRLKKAPSWGKKAILQLNWVFDEYFVVPDVWEAVFAPFDVGSRPAVLDKTGAVLNSVLQLDIPSSCELALEGRPLEVCADCGREKYLPISRGFFPAPDSSGEPIFKSRQYFGSGGSAFQAVLVSNALYQKLRDAKVRGVEFAPCKQQSAN